MFSSARGKKGLSSLGERGSSMALVGRGIRMLDRLVATVDSYASGGLV